MSNLVFENNIYLMGSIMAEVEGAIGDPIYSKADEPFVNDDGLVVFGERRLLGRKQLVSFDFTPDGMVVSAESDELLQAVAEFVEARDA